MVGVAGAVFGGGLVNGRGVWGCLVMVAVLSLATMGLVWGWWPILAVGAGLAGLGFGVRGFVGWRASERRLLTVSRILQEHYAMNEHRVDIGMLVPVVDDEELLRAAAHWKAARDLELAQRYRNGDASDY